MSFFVLGAAVCGEEILVLQRSPCFERVHCIGASERGHVVLLLPMLCPLPSLCTHRCTSASHATPSYPVPSSCLKLAVSSHKFPCFSYCTRSVYLHWPLSLPALPSQTTVCGCRAHPGLRPSVLPIPTVASPSSAPAPASSPSTPSLGAVAAPARVFVVLHVRLGRCALPQNVRGLAGGAPCPPSAEEPALTSHLPHDITTTTATSRWPSRPPLRMAASLWATAGSALATPMHV